MKQYLRPRSVSLVALACGAGATLFAWYMAGRQVEVEARAEFANQANLAASVLERRVQRYIDILYGLEALFYQQDELSRKGFSQYVAALELPRRFRGVLAVEFIRTVPFAERERFIERVRRDTSVRPGGYPEFDIKPPGTRDEAWVIDYVEPLEPNRTAFGVDIRTRDIAREAAMRARDTGEAVATGRYRLVQETGQSKGLVIYLPVYRDSRVQALRERRDQLRGFVNVVLRVDDVLADVSGEPYLAGLRWQLFDIGATGTAVEDPMPVNLFYRLPVGGVDIEPAWYDWKRVYSRRVTVAGRQWHMRFDEVPSLSPWLQPMPLLVLAAMCLLTLLLFGLLNAIARTRSDAVDLAEKATHDLRSQLWFTQQLLEAMPNPVFFKDSAGRYLGCNRAFEDYVGLPRADFIGKTIYEIAPQDQADRSVSADRALLEQPGTQNYESTVFHARDGKKREVIFNKATFVDTSGKAAGIVGILVDITQRKQLEAATRENAEKLRAVIEATPVAIIARDLRRVIAMWNPAAERMFGWKESEVLNTDTSIVPVHLRDETDRLRRRAEAGETIWIEETQRQARDGSAVDVSMSIAPLYGGEGTVIGTMVTIADISPRKRAEAALRESEARLLLAMEAAQMGMWYWECDTDRFTYSDGLGRLFGFAPGEAKVDYRELQSHLHPADRVLFEASVRHSIKKGSDFTLDYRVIWPDGSEHWLSNRAQVHRGPDARAHRIVGVSMDITERKLAEQRIAHMAHHDALTGLPNRVLLRDRIQQAIAQAHRNEKQVAVLFLDLDRFKTINDSLGHQFGDRLLQAVASRILVCVREGDTVSRVGGDEFVIVVPGIANSADASSVAEKILEVLANSFHLQGNDLHVATSIGVSLYPSDGSDAETLMRNADTAMYHAKDTGRGNYQFFTQHMNVAAQRRLTLENALRRAIDNQEFELYFQPLFDLRDRSITGFEALVRWVDPNGQVVPPSQFIAAAEDSGLIVPIGDWVLREAIRQAKTWQQPGRALSVAVNVSANQLSRAGFVDGLRKLIREAGIDPARIELEVTENLIIEGASEARATLDAVAQLGVGIAIDDFGTGYSGLAYLKRLPIDTVKIDQSFVRDLTVDPDDLAIVTAIVAMARGLGLDVIAEGVETEEQVDELKRLGCMRAQGYLFARPMTGAAVTKLLQAREAAAASAD